MPLPGTRTGAYDGDVDKELTAERTNADRLANALRLVLHYGSSDRAFADMMHAVIVLQAEITLGDVVEGALALHREIQKDRSE